MINVILADDQQLFLDSLLIVFESRAQDIKVVGTAKDGREAIELIEKQQPDVAILDVRMPVMDGVMCTKIVNKRFPAVQIMMLTTFDDDEYVHEALSNGATGYMLKDIPPNELLAAVRSIHNGAVSMSPSIMHRLISRAGQFREIEQHDGDPLESLSVKELRILELIGSGYQNRQIAEKTYLAEQTVKNYISVIYQKIGATSRFEAIQFINGLKAFQKRLSSEPGRTAPNRKLP